MNTLILFYFSSISSLGTTNVTTDGFLVVFGSVTFYYGETQNLCQYTFINSLLTCLMADVIHCSKESFLYYSCIVSKSKG